LVTDIGPRPSGSKAYARAAKIVLKEMQRTLPEVNYDNYEFDDWGPVSSSDLIVAGQHIEAIPHRKEVLERLPNRSRGDIYKKWESGYAITDEQSAQILAYFSVSQYGKSNRRNSKRKPG
jgi:hypothetical protein